MNYCTKTMKEGKEEIRKEVIEFAGEMEMVLRKNDYKTGWDNMSIHQLFARIKDEFEELQREYILYCESLDPHTTKVRTENIRNESIDIANFCMFLCHNYPGK